MSFLFSELRRVTNDLHQSGVPWCLVGGLATSVYVEPRTTKDLDVVVSVPNNEQGDTLKDLLVGVERSLKEITTRGFSPGRDLLAELNEIETGQGYDRLSRPSSSRFLGVLQRLAGLSPNLRITRAALFSLILSAIATRGEPYAGCFSMTASISRRSASSFTGILGR